MFKRICSVKLFLISTLEVESFLLMISWRSLVFPDAPRIKMVCQLVWKCSCFPSQKKATQERKLTNEFTLSSRNDQLKTD
jgi:hypothetical protein